MEPAAPPEPSPVAAVAAAPRPRLLQRLLPWISLAVGIASAVLMDRGPKRGAVVAGAGVVVWLVLIAQRWLAGLSTTHGRVLGKVIWLARQSSLMATQSLVQLTLFFALPFFVRAADLRDPGHAAFLIVLAVLAAIALWDPLTEWLFAHPRLGALLPAASSFVALTAVLPGLHLSTQQSVWIASAVAGAGAALVLLAGTQAGARARNVPLALLLVAALPLALWLGALRMVPAAPLRLVTVQFGTRVADHWVADPLEDGAPVPARLFCATAISAPLGVRDRLFHVWRRDGKQRERIELKIAGGRTAGFRTFSRITPGRNGAGRYRCTVETASGQVLGGKTLVLRAKPQGG